MGIGDEVASGASLASKASVGSVASVRSVVCSVLSGACSSLEPLAIGGVISVCGGV